MAFGLIAAVMLMLIATGVYFDRGFFHSHFTDFLDTMPFTLADNQSGKKEANADPRTRPKSSTLSQAGSISASQDDQKNVAPSKPVDGNAPATQEAPGGTAKPDTPTSMADLKTATESPSGDASPPQSIKATSETATDFVRLISDAKLTRDAAFARLFSSWGSEAPDGAIDECLFAKQNNLRCLSSNGNISLLSKLDHPAILEFVLPDGANRYATLIGLQGQKWVLGMGKSNISLDPTEMLPYWRGNFTLLWRPLVSTTGIIKLGKNNEAVRWVRLQLNEPAALGKETFFDDRLQHSIMFFQRNNSLRPDGEVGPMTMIQLQKASHNYMWPSLAKTKD